MVNELDRTPVDDAYRGTGSEPYDPIAMLKMVLFQMLRGIHSPSKWCRAAEEKNEPMLWLGRGCVPCQRVWYYFRDRANKFIESLFVEANRRAVSEGLTDADAFAMDGTSKAALGSRHQRMNLRTLEKRQTILRDLLQPKQDDQPQIPKWVPTAEEGRKNLLKQMDIAHQVLKDLHSRNQCRPKSKRKDPNKIYVSVTDPEAPFGLDKLKTYRFLYTVQKWIDPVSRLILGYRCTTQTNDTGMLVVCCEQHKDQYGKYPATVFADGGYSTIADLKFVDDHDIDLLAPTSKGGTERRVILPSGEKQIPRGEFEYDPLTDTYRCPAGQILSKQGQSKKWREGDQDVNESRYQCGIDVCGKCPLSSRCFGGKTGRIIKRTEGEDLVENQRAKMGTAEAQEAYKKRPSSIETTFGDEKWNRDHDRFHGKGQWRAVAESGLLYLAQNLQRIYRLRQLAPHE